MSSDVVSAAHEGMGSLAELRKQANDLEEHASKVLAFLKDSIEEWKRSVSEDTSHFDEVVHEFHEKSASLHAEEASTLERIDQGWSMVGGELGGHLDELVSECSACGEQVNELRGAAESYSVLAQAALETHLHALQGTTQVVGEVSSQLSAEVRPELGQIGNGLEQGINNSLTHVQAQLQQHLEDLDGERDEAQTSTSSGLKQALDSALNFRHDQAEKQQTHLNEVDNLVSGLIKGTGEFSNNLVTVANKSTTSADELKSGADGVASALQTTNVGLNTVVHIVQSVVQIFDDVVDDFHS
jgi:hypothetical protein